MTDKFYRFDEDELAKLGTVIPDILGYVPMEYDCIIDQEWHNNLDFCNCGNPEESQIYLKNVLQAIKTKTDNQDSKIDTWNIDGQNVIDTIREAGVHYFVLYVLDAIGLTEHGSSIGGSWLSQDGEELLKELSK